ncbi:MAG: CoA pyrophosphatase [Acidimicrobiales bacterium]
MGAAAPWAGRPLPESVAEVAEIVARSRPHRPRVEAVDGRPPSAVLVPFRDGVDGPELLFTRRAWHLRSHKGEVCFPGGRLEPGDPDLATTALRETHEEIDLPPSSVRLVGELDRLTTVSSPSFIVPFVGLIDGEPTLTPATNEVDGILRISLRELADPVIFREELWTRDGNEMAIYFFELVGDTLWGATARMVHNLLRLVTAE